MNNVISQIGKTPIEKRDFMWYHRAAYKGGITKDQIKQYEDIMNSKEYSDWGKYADNELTKGAIEVNEYIDRWGIQTELDEYMLDLTLVDIYILENVKEK